MGLMGRPRAAIDLDHHPRIRRRAGGVADRDLVVVLRLTGPGYNQESSEQTDRRENGPSGWNSIH
jgi:hypothetical protein